MQDAKNSLSAQCAPPHNFAKLCLCN